MQRLKKRAPGGRWRGARGTREHRAQESTANIAAARRATRGRQGSRAVRTRSGRRGPRPERHRGSAKRQQHRHHKAHSRSEPHTTNTKAQRAPRQGQGPRRATRSVNSSRSDNTAARGTLRKPRPKPQETQGQSKAAAAQAPPAHSRREHTPQTPRHGEHQGRAKGLGGRACSVNLVPTGKVDLILQQFRWRGSSP